jgi:hypothetical protein
MDAGVSVGSIIKGSNEVIVRVNLATGPGVTILREPSEVSTGVGLG